MLCCELCISAIGSVTVPSAIDTQLYLASVVLAEELHYGRAARRLHVAISTLSKQVARLEDSSAWPRTIAIGEFRNRLVPSPAPLVLESLPRAIPNVDQVPGPARPC
jgi:Bacterial regulatory helix-turn-helix protein, lysR family